MFSLFGSILILVGFVALAFFYGNALVLEGDRARVRAWLIDWVGKGLLFPLLLWLICNIGATPILPPFVDSVLLGKVTGEWNKMLTLTPPAVLVISSYWAAISFAWLLPNLNHRFENRGELLSLIGIWSVIMLIPVGCIFHSGGWLWAGFAALVCFVPMAHFTPAAIPERPSKPIYARAIAKLKFGKYNEAEMAVISELEKFEDDFDGWLMLADIYANHFHDLPEAERTIRTLVAHPHSGPTEISVAFHRLADWHLKLNGDPVAARRALSEICELLPGTHLAHMARLRIKQLPASAEELKASREGRKYHLPALAEQTNDDAPATETTASESESVAKANAWVKTLEANPKDLAARENLARIMAEQLGQPEEAIAQIELLLELPDQPDQKMAEWLAMIATWHIRQRQDWDAGRKCLERIVHDFPQTSEAFAAQRRITLREMEGRLRQVRLEGAVAENG